MPDSLRQPPLDGGNSNARSIDQSFVADANADHGLPLVDDCVDWVRALLFKPTAQQQS